MSRGARDLKDYIEESRESYKSLMLSLAFRAQRGAVLMYNDAAASEKLLSWWFLGSRISIFVVCCIIVGAKLYEAYTGYIVGITFALEAGIDFLNRYPNPLKDYLLKRSNDYVEAASKWQLLEQKAYSFLIFIKDPNITVGKCFKNWMTAMYDAIVVERDQITSRVIVSKKTYDKITMESIFKRIKENKKVLDEFKRFKVASNEY